MFKFALLAVACLAHFDVLNPTPRDVVEDLETVAPCGGSPSSATRVPISLSSNRLLSNKLALDPSNIGIKSYHKDEVFDFNISFDETETFQVLAPQLKRGRRGEQFTDLIDYSKFGGVVGQNATIQFIGDDEGFRTFQCADIYFVL
jgi:hypothetical protein